MTTADYALIVSICSGVVALGSLGWNIWSKFIYPKPRLRARFAAVVMLDGQQPAPRFLSLTLTNHGPIECTVHSVHAAFARKWPKKPQHALINPIHDVNRPQLGVGPFAGGLPKKLAVGETFSLYFPHSADSFARDDINAFGVTDTFGRWHKVSRKDLKEVRQALAEAYPDQAAPDHIRNMEARDAQRDE